MSSNQKREHSFITNFQFWCERCKWDGVIQLATNWDWTSWGAIVQISSGETGNPGIRVKTAQLQSFAIGLDHQWLMHGINTGHILFSWKILCWSQIRAYMWNDKWVWRKWYFFHNKFL
jgi:hypothetical protein